uniref:RNA-dependent RNA polymerase n=1 Tax=Riboviria sp. TaxID=2585031 RepID=A0A8B0RKK9_9VIRU|nr:RNA-dependent RNA polymerase [Riboviria sp.]
MRTQKNNKTRKPQRYDIFKHDDSESGIKKLQELLPAQRPENKPKLGLDLSIRKIFEKNKEREAARASSSCLYRIPNNKGSYYRTETAELDKTSIDVNEELICDLLDRYVENITSGTFAIDSSESKNSLSTICSLINECNRGFIPLQVLYNLVEPTDAVTNKVKVLEKLSEKIDSIKEHISAPCPCANESVKGNYTELKLLLDRGNVYLVCDGKVRHQIGKTNAPLKKEIPVSAKLWEIQHDSFQIATSCEFPKTQSNSPSMAIHQTVSIMFMKSLLDCRVEFEYQGGTHPDLLVLTNGSSYLFDFTTSKVASKLANVSSKHPDKTHVIIDKYKIFDCLGHEMDLLIQLSKENEVSPVKMINRLVEKQASYTSRTARASTRIMDFFAKGSDPMGRPMYEHYVQAKNSIMHLFYSVGPDRKEFNRESLMDTLKLSLSSYVSDLGQVYDNHFHCYPPYNDISELCDNNKLNEIYKEYEACFRGKSTKVDSDTIGVTCSITDEDVKRTRQWFTMINDFRVIKEVYDYLGNYANNKFSRNLSKVDVVNAVLKLYSKDNTLSYCASVVQRICNHSDFMYDGATMGLKIRDFKGNENLKIASQYRKLDYHISMEKNSNWIKMDPDHTFTLMNEKCTASLYCLANLRNYHDLQQKARVARLITEIIKPGSKSRMYHHLDGSKYVEIMIRGKILANDQGVVYVNYFYMDQLYRAELWRLPDVENYMVAHHKIVAMALCIENRLLKRNIIDYKQFHAMIIMYSSILKDNSWGVSKFMKVYRYVSHGMCVKNPLTDEAIEKCICELGTVGRKQSIYVMSKILEQGLGKKDGTTPLFGLPYDLLTYEIFMVNLCPSKTYGKRKHLSDVVAELYSEIDLYEEFEEENVKLWKDFEELLVSSDLKLAYQKYASSIDNFSKLTSGRFTNTPMAVVLISQQLHKVFSKYYTLQNSLPSISTLLTAKASTSDNDMSPCIAAQSITDLLASYKCKSTSQAIWKIIGDDSHLNLCMRIFDKDQVGGNREISILNSKFRLLVVATEYFWRKFNENLPNEYLHKANKTRDLCQNSKRFFEMRDRLFCSIDQTRWGPNHSTSIFGLMTLLLCRKTTEATIASLSCFLGEFKLFENPPWVTEHMDKVTDFQGVIGRIAPGHMGQGIYHVVSSSFHALMTNELLAMMTSFILKKGNIYNLRVHTASMVTSDDCTMMIGANPKLVKPSEEMSKMDGVREKMERERLRRCMRVCMEVYPKLLKYFGVKTSSYKNIISDKYLEFNSIYVSEKGVVLNDIKFIGALVDPCTTGVLTTDYFNVLNSYHSSSNSGCSKQASHAIATANYWKFLRHWKLDMRRAGCLNRELVERGPPVVFDLNPSSDHTVDFKIAEKSYLRHKLRKLYTDVMSAPVHDVISAMIKNNLSSIHNSKSITPYKACKTFYQGPGEIRTFSQGLAKLGAVGITHECAVSEWNRDPLFTDMLVNNEVQDTYMVRYSSKITSDDVFEPMIIKQTESENLDIFRLLVSYYPRQDFVTSRSTNDEIILHMMRKSWSGESVMAFNQIMSKGKTLIEKMDLIISVSNQIYSKEGLVLRLKDYLDEPVQSYIMVTNYMRKSVSNFTRIISLRCLTEKNYESFADLSCVSDYIGEIKFKTNGQLEQEKKVIGLERFDAPALIRKSFHMPSILECAKYLDRDVYKIDSEYSKSRNITKMYACLDVPKKIADRYSLLKKTDCSQLFDLPEIKSYEDFVSSLTSTAEALTNNYSGNADNDGFAFLFDQPETVKICIEQSPDCSVICDNYFRKRLIANSLLHKMNEEGAVHIEGICNYLPAGVADGRTRIFAFDRSVAEEINHSNIHFMALSSQEFGYWMDEYEVMIRECCFKPLFDHETGEYKFQEFIARSHPFVRYQPQPSGEIMNNDDGLRTFCAIYRDMVEQFGYFIPD